MIISNKNSLRKNRDKKIIILQIKWGWFMLHSDEVSFIIIKRNFDIKFKDKRLISIKFLF